MKPDVRFKYKKKTIKKIYKDAIEGKKYVDIAKENKVTYNTIYKILNKKYLNDATNDYINKCIEDLEIDLF